MKRQIEFNDDSRDKLKAGVEKLAKAVEITLGPKGRNVVINRAVYMPPHVTKDGVTVAKEIFLDDPIEDIGAQMIKEVAIRTVNDAGDGTTTAIVLAKAILNQGLEKLKNGGNPVMINKGIKKASDVIVSELKKMSIRINTKEELTHVATVSSNHDKEIGDIIGKAMYEVGEEGVVVAEVSQNGKTAFEIVEGMQISNGLITPHFINNASKMNCVLEQPLILIVDEKISKFQDIENILNHCIREQESLLIICNDMEGEALSTCAMNNEKGAFKLAIVKSPGWGAHKKNMLLDLAIMTGTIVSSETNGTILKTITPDMLGRCERVESNRDQTIIVGGNGSKEKIKKRIKEIRDNIDIAKDDDEKKEFKERLAKIIGGVGIIRIGAKTDLAINEKKDRIDDALSATVAAREEGIVSGGGVALIRCISVLDDLSGDNKDEDTGIEIVKEAIEMPMKKILENAGLDTEKIFKEILDSKNFNFGYDAREEKFVDDMVKKGIIDPTKVTRCATENAAEIAGLILTTECVIADIQPEK